MTVDVRRKQFFPPLWTDPEGSRKATLLYDTKACRGLRLGYSGAPTSALLARPLLPFYTHANHLAGL
jgi:hypothetical protein